VLNGDEIQTTWLVKTSYVWCSGGQVFELAGYGVAVQESGEGLGWQAFIYRHPKHDICTHRLAWVTLTCVDLKT
jgi:hypothetical protein